MTDAALRSPTLCSSLDLGASLVTVQSVLPFTAITGDRSSNLTKGRLDHFEGPLDRCYAEQGRGGRPQGSRSRQRYHPGESALGLAKRERRQVIGEPRRCCPLRHQIAPRTNAVG